MMADTSAIEIEALDDPARSPGGSDLSKSAESEADHD
jgi:hypothetical protein